MDNSICYNCFRTKNAAIDVCPHCGYSGASAQAANPLALPHGSVLNGRYIVGRVLGQGGFGITYLAQDYVTKQLVAIKEYMPHSMAMRRDSLAVTAYAGYAGDNFQYGKDCFLKEAKTLSTFKSNPNIVRIHHYFEENNTAYFVMDYVQGESFQQYIKKNGGRIPWQDAQRIIIPVINALGAVHSRGIIHRDVTPDNIYITSDGTVKLLDFGAARYSLGDQTHSLSVILKHGFAPQEQYMRHSRQGAYTDVYAVAASYYFAVTGHRPPDSIERMAQDNIKFPRTLGVQIPIVVETAIMKGLSVNAEDRFQTMDEFCAALEFVQRKNMPQSAQPQQAPQPKPQAKPQPKPQPERVPVQPVQPHAQPIPTPTPALAAAQTEPDRIPVEPPKRKKKKSGWVILPIPIVFIILSVGASVLFNRPSDTTGCASSETGGYESTATPTPIPTPTEETEANEGTSTKVEIPIESDEWLEDVSDTMPTAMGIVQQDGNRIPYDPKYDLTITQSPTPTVSAKPTTTPQPTATARPTATIKPTATTRPTATAKPTTTSKPESTKKTDGKLSNKVLATGSLHTVGLKSNGTVVATGFNSDGQCDVSNWRDIVAVSASGNFTVGLKSDGTVVAKGSDKYGECDVSSWRNITAISSGAYSTIGLKSDGTVVATRYNDYGQSNVSSWRDIVAVSAGTWYSVGVKSNGTVVATGDNRYGQGDVSNWRKIIAVSAGSVHTVGLKSDGTVVATGLNNHGQCNVSSWRDIVAVSAMNHHTIGLKSDGTVVATGDNSYGQCNVSSWRDIVAISAGNDYTVGVKSDGTVVATGKNRQGKCNVSDWILKH